MSEDSAAYAERMNKARAREKTPSASWRDHLYLGGKGAFRGVEFYVSSVVSDIGRRVVVHEFPGQDKPFVEDVGRKTRRFTLEAFVFGDNYMYERDRLKAEFEKAGSGLLNHPFWGMMSVTIEGGVKLTETTAEGGMAKFTLTVVEGGNALATISKADTAAVTAQKADIALDAAAAEFSAVFAVAGFIGDVLDAAAAVVNEVTSTIARVNGKINAVMNKVDAIGDSIAALGDSVSDLLLLPQSLAAAVQGVIGDIVGSVNAIGSAWDSYFGDDETPGNTPGAPSKAPTGASPASGDVRATMLLEHLATFAGFGNDLGVVALTTPQRIQQSVNQAAILTLVRSSAVIEACRTSVSIPYASYDRAVAVRDALIDQLDALSEATADDAAYAALVDLRAAVARHLTDASAALPKITVYTPKVTTPALVIAQRLYGDSRRELEILERNNVHNPCQIPGGIELEVLSGG